MNSKHLNNRFDFASYDIASEAVEIKRDHGIRVKRMNVSGLNIEQLDILNPDNIYNKRVGRYSLIDNSKDMSIESLKEAFKTALNSFIKKWHLKKSSALLLGIGNKNYAPDALGPEVSSRINASLDKKRKKILSLSPGVFAQTGIDCASLAKAVIKEEDIDYVIAIDSLVTHKLNRLNKVIQISDGGIAPGSGIGNRRKELSQDYLKVPVISIGVATVVNKASIIKDFIDSYNIDRASYRMLSEGISDLKKDDPQSNDDLHYDFLILAEIISSVINDLYK